MWIMYLAIDVTEGSDGALEFFASDPDTAAISNDGDTTNINDLITSDGWSNIFASHFAPFVNGSETEDGHLLQCNPSCLDEFISIQANKAIAQYLQGKYSPNLAGMKLYPGDKDITMTYYNSDFQTVYIAVPLMFVIRPMQFAQCNNLTPSGNLNTLFQYIYGSSEND